MALLRVLDLPPPRERARDRASRDHRGRPIVFVSRIGGGHGFQRCVQNEIDATLASRGLRSHRRSPMTVVYTFTLDGVRRDDDDGFAQRHRGRLRALRAGVISWSAEVATRVAADTVPACGRRARDAQGCGVAPASAG